MKTTYSVTDGNELHQFTSKVKALKDFNNAVNSINRLNEHDKKGMVLQLITNETNSKSVVLKEKKW